MDNSKLRRKQPTVNAKWNDNVAILSGDGMMYIASQYVFAAPENVRKQIMDLYHKTAIEVCEGQQFDMDFETSDDVTLDDYIKMITLKTAVLPAACLKIGALIGGASEDEAQKLYDAGISFGGDVNECKKTVFFHKMTELMPKERVGEWQQFYANKQFAFEEKLQIARCYFAEYKVDAAVQNIIEEYYAKAFSILDTIAAADRIAPLREFMEKLRVRID